MGKAITWFNRQWKESPQDMVMTAILICLAIAWCILSVFTQQQWSVWLFIPLFCINGILIFTRFRARKFRSAICAVGSFVMLAWLALRSLLDTQASNMHVTISLICLAIVIILTAVSKMLPKDEDTAAET